MSTKGTVDELLRAGCLEAGIDDVAAFRALERAGYALGCASHGELIEVELPESRIVEVIDVVAADV